MGGGGEWKKGGKGGERGRERNEHPIGKHPPFAR